MCVCVVSHSHQKSPRLKGTATGISYSYKSWAERSFYTVYMYMYCFNELLYSVCAYGPIASSSLCFPCTYIIVLTCIL